MKCTSSSRVCCEQNESFRIRLLYPISDLFSPLSLLPGQPTLFFPPPIQFLPFSHGPTRIFQSPIILFVIRVKNPRPLRDLHDLTRTNSRARTKIGTGRDWYQPGNGYGCWFERSRGDNRSGGNGKMTYCLKVLLRYRDLFVRGEVVESRTTWGEGEGRRRCGRRDVAGGRWCGRGRGSNRREEGAASASNVPRQRLEGIGSTNLECTSGVATYLPIFRPILPFSLLTKKRKKEKKESIFLFAPR